MEEKKIPPYPTVGIGVVITNKEGKVLVGKRIGKHAPGFSIPGGHLELGESFESCAKREVLEETGLILNETEILGIVNNLETFEKEGKHTVSVIMGSSSYQGTPTNLEPHKCEGWKWVDPNQLPTPHFEASEKGIGFLKNQRK